MSHNFQVGDLVEAIVDINSVFVTDVEALDNAYINKGTRGLVESITCSGLQTIDVTFPTGRVEVELGEIRKVSILERLAEISA